MDNAQLLEEIRETNLTYLLLLLLGGTYGIEGLVRGIVFSSLLGVSGAAVFWVIAVRPRESQAQPNVA